MNVIKSKRNKERVKTGMEKYDAAFSDMENRLIEEARMIPPRLEVIEECLRAGADLNKIGAHRHLDLFDRMM